MILAAVAIILALAFPAEPIPKVYPTYPPDGMSREQVIKWTRACTTEQIADCGDLICEGDLEFEPVIYYTGWALERCLKHGLFDDAFLREDVQREVLKVHKLEWWDR